MPHILDGYLVVLGCSFKESLRRLDLLIAPHLIIVPFLLQEFFLSFRSQAETFHQLLGVVIGQRSELRFYFISGLSSLYLLIERIELGHSTVQREMLAGDLAEGRKAALREQSTWLCERFAEH